MTIKAMSSHAVSGSGPVREMRAPSLVIEPRRGLFDLDLGALWEYRELLYFLVWRDVKVRYKQTVIGAGRRILLRTAVHHVGLEGKSQA